MSEKRKIQKTFLVALGKMESVLQLVRTCGKNANVSRAFELSRKNLEENKKNRFLFSDEHARAKLVDAKAANSNRRRVFKKLVQLSGKNSSICGPETYVLLLRFF